MLLKIICIVVLVARPQVLCYEDDGDETPQGYLGEDDDDYFGSYHQDNDEDVNPVRIRRFESNPKVKTLSPQELQEVRGAIQQILSGHNQNNPFTPLPRIQPSNEKRSISHSQAIQKPRSARMSQENDQFDNKTKENDQFNDRTKFSEYTDVIDNTKSEIQTFTRNDALTTEDPTKTPPFTKDENYDTDSINDIIDGTINSLSSLPVIPATDDITKPDMSSVTMDEILTDNDITTKTTETINYVTETNIGLTGATINALPSATISLRGRIDTDDIKSEINSILGKNFEQLNNITSTDFTPEDKNDNELVGATISVLATRSRLPKIVRTDSMESIEVTASTEGEDLNEMVPKEIHESMEEATTAEASKKEAPIEEEASKEEASEEEASTEETSKKKSSKKEKFTESDLEEYPSSTKQDEDTTEHNPTLTIVPGVSGNMTITTHNQTLKTVAAPNRTTTTRRTRRTTTTKFKLDVPALLALIANLTYDYEMNLTDNLNETLLKLSIPTCETPTTTSKKGILIDYDANATGTIVAKCFVCGLDVDNIPRNAHCADAFAGDFLPLVPVDMTARGKISKYRKYCRFADVPHYMTNETQPRSVFGRWTGGCSVRWIDLSGVYTQRSCRNRERAIMGRHFASKRMAKLEMALSNVDNGCITSPMATLVPLSRGISLYARFHACVCTGSWCNAADIPVPWTIGSLLPLLVAYISPHLLV